jgi:hypothetical protein
MLRLLVLDATPSTLADGLPVPYFDSGVAHVAQVI